MGKEWVPVEVTPSRTKQFVTPDGRLFWDCEVEISAEWAAELHHGYRCARCLQPLHELGAFPERCPLCQFEVAKYQRQQLERQYRGVDSSIVTPGIPLERELEILEREAYRPKGLITMSIPKKKKKG